MNGYVLFAITVILQTTGQILEKYGLNRLTEPITLSNIPASIKTVLSSPYIVAGVACSAFGLIFWIAALSRFKLSFMYPLGAIIYILIAIASHWILKESVSATHWIGIIIICAGVFLLNYGQ